MVRVVGLGDRQETRGYDDGLNLSDVTVSNAMAGEVLRTRLRYGANNCVTNAAMGYRSPPGEWWTYGWDARWLGLNRRVDSEGHEVARSKPLKQETVL